MDEDIFLSLTEDDDNDVVAKYNEDDTFEKNNFSNNEILEIIKLDKCINIFTKNIHEIILIKKINEDILKKKIFIHYTYLPINVFIYVLYTKDIIIFDSILYHKFKKMFNINVSHIIKKNNKFCEMLQIPYIYNVNKQLTKFINGYYYIINIDNRDNFIDYSSFTYFQMLNITKKFLNHMEKKTKIIVPYVFCFDNIFLLNRLMIIFTMNKKIKTKLNFLLYNNLIESIIPKKKSIYIAELITNEFINEIEQIIF